MIGVVRGLIHAHELGCQMKEQGCFKLSAALVFGATFHKVPDIDGHEIYDLGRRGARQGRKEGFQVRFVTLRRNDDDFGDPVIVPTREEFVAGTMESLATKRAGARVRRPIRLRKAIVEGRGNDDAKLSGQSAGYSFRNERVGSERQMGPVVIEGSHRPDEPRVALEVQTNFGPGEVVQLK